MGEQNADYVRVAETVDFGTPSALKKGRTAALPYVPTLRTADGREHFILGLAFATRDEAVARAEQHVASLRSNLARQLAEPRMRALREQHGLPREAR